MKKPHADFPLFRHQCGQWVKKIKGKLYYFGTVSDAALDRYLDEKDNILAGRDRTIDARMFLTLSDLCNLFLTSKKLAMQSGELTPRTFNDYFRISEALVDFFGKTKGVLDLTPQDFEKFRAKLGKTQGPVSLRNCIIRSRVLFKYAFDNYIIDKPVRFGAGL